MKLEDQVVSLELAKRLKELGVKQESVFYYRLDGSIGQGFNSDVVDGKMVWNISAFTVAELGKMLPVEYVSYKHSLGFWETCQITTSNQALFGQFPHELRADTEADARAKMLIHLIEQKLVKP